MDIDELRRMTVEERKNGAKPKKSYWATFMIDAETHRMLEQLCRSHRLTATKLMVSMIHTAHKQLEAKKPQ